MLSSFLLELDIPQDDGIIDADHTIDVSNPKRLSAAVAALRESYPGAEVELYLASLVAMDRETWGGLDTLLRERTG